VFNMALTVVIVSLNTINRVGFYAETQCVSCEVRTKLLCIIYKKFGLYRVVWTNGTRNIASRDKLQFRKIAEIKTISVMLILQTVVQFFPDESTLHCRGVTDGVFKSAEQ
jgi:hypothetical protein